MHFDLSMQGKAAREAIAVPDVPMSSILRRSRAARSHDRVRGFIACAGLALCAVGAAAYGERAVEGIRVWLSGGKGAVVVDSLTMTREPMASELRAIVAKATFPVVLPVGLPAGSHVRWVIYSPVEHPTTIAISLVRDVDHEVGTFTLIDPSIVNASALPSGARRPEFRTLRQWRAGEEIVTGGLATAKWADLGAVESAMARATPQGSLDAMASTLPKVVVLGAPVRLDVAERVRPDAGLSVLVERRQVDDIARSSHFAPIDDNRTYSLYDIPYANGEPQYEKAKISFPKARLIAANGVRAIAAAVRSAGGPTCGCAVLFNQPDEATYWIWTIPIAGSPSATKYAVDAKTFAVTRAG
jgi:hypothetical protein